MRPYSNLAQPNHLGTLLAIACVLALWLRANGSLGSVGTSALIAWFTLGLTLTESRAALLSAFSVGAVLVAKRANAPGLPRPRWIALWLAILTALALVWPKVNEGMLFSAPRGALAAKDSARAVIWTQCLSGIAQSPWVGWGWRQSMAGQKAGAARHPGYQPSDYAHDIVLDLLLWVGVPLGLLMTGAGTWWLVRLLLRTSGTEETLLFAAILPVLVHSMFEFPFAYAYFLFPATWMLARLATLQRDRLGARPEASAQPASRWPVALVLALLATVLLAAGRDYVLAEEDTRVMRFEMRHVGRTPEGYEPPHLWVLSQLGETLVLGRMTAHAGMTAAELERLHQGSIRFGWPSVHAKYALALALNGQPGAAAHEMALLRAIYGDDAYRAALASWREFAASHPELATVSLPAAPLP